MHTDSHLSDDAATSSSLPASRRAHGPTGDAATSGCLRAHAPAFRTVTLMDRLAPARPTPERQMPVPARALAGGLLVLALLLAVGVVVAKVVSTSAARVAASTSTDGFLTAGTLELSRADDSASLLVDADGLYPGLPVDGCVELAYAGSVPADLRLLGERRSGTGLDEYVELTVHASTTGTCESPLDDGSERFDGRLDELWTAHARYATGVHLVTARPGERVVLRTVAVVVDDNRAAGLTTDFVVTIEGRPA